jgi:membrane-bound metal-dependent hydrolase YbcI (DUF457 family)
VGYLLAKGSSKLLKTKVNLPTVFALSIIPDVDLIIPVLQHRGPTHSLILAFAAFIPFLIVYRRKAVPYMLALVSHALIGDYVTGQIQLFWPLPQEYGLTIDITSPASMALEWAVFLAAIATMLKTRDAATLLQPHNSNLILAIPTFTALLPTLLSYPLAVPVWLVPPHIVYIIMFSASITITLSNTLNIHLHSIRTHPTGSSNPKNKKSTRQQATCSPAENCETPIDTHLQIQHANQNDKLFCLCSRDPTSERTRRNLVRILKKA